MTSFFITPGVAERALRAIGEAGTVGGLADWFAVVALFRRPLGLPIPHTALIPRKKAAIGFALGRFVERNFLDPDHIVAEIRKEDRAKALGTWLKSPQNAGIVARSIAGTLLMASKKGMHLDAVSAFMPVAKSLRKNLGEDIKEFVSKTTGRLIPGVIDRFVADRIGVEIDRLLDSLQTPGSTEREKLDAFITSKLNDIPRKFGPLIAKIALEAQGAEIIARLGTGEPSEELVSAIEAVIVWAGDSLLQGEELRGQLNLALENVVVEYISPFGTQISGYISRVVESWSGERIAQTLELQVGADLQFIRVNGTLIGMLAGLALFGLGEGLIYVSSVR